MVDKPEGPTSHDVVAVARRALATREIGHTGTLDPMATGVLVLVAGRATRLARFLSGAEKAYDVTVRLGVETDSGDRTGVVIGEHSVHPADPGLPAVRDALDGLTGTREQLPPPLSAKRLGGVRAYTLARAGADVPVRPVVVTLFEAAIVGYEPPWLRLSVRCSAGFYVRALARDLGRRLGCGASLDALRRTVNGEFALSRSVPLDVLAADPAAARAALIGIDDLLPGLASARLNETGTRKARHGNDISPADVVGALPLVEGDQAMRLVDEGGRLVAIARRAGQPGLLHPAVVLQ